MAAIIDEVLDKKQLGYKKLACGHLQAFVKQRR